MQRPIYIIRAKRPTAVASVTFGPAEVEFRRCWDDKGACVMVAVIKGDNPHRGIIVRQAQMMGESYQVTITNPVQAWEDPMIPANHEEPVVDAGGVAAGPPLAALKNGWSADDLAGAGIGDLYDARGGRSSLSGLTMAEMSLSQPPGDWERMRGLAYPWEAADWQSPGIQWVPPADLAAAKGPQGPEMAVDPDVAALNKAEAEVDNADHSVDPVLETTPDPDPVKPEKTQKPLPPASDEDADAEVLAAYGSAEQVTQAVAILQEITRAADGVVPTKSKATYHLDKHELPKPKKAEFEALLRAATPN